MQSIFISYRRDSAVGYGGRLHEALSDRFGPERVFRDIDSIRPGTDFTQVIREAIARSGVVLALIDRDWLSVTNSTGQRRLDDPNDFVRLELSTAIEQQTVVIPVLVERARLPGASELPEPLKGLGRYQGIELSEDRWAYDIDRLATRLGEIVAAPAQPAGSSRRRSAKGRTLAIGGAVVTVVLMVAAVVLLRGSGPPPDTTSPREVQVHVLARGPRTASGWGMRWTDTGIDVDDQVVRIEASGQVSAGDGVFVPPDGTPDRPDYDAANVLRGAQHAGLIGKFGKSGQPFVVGSHYRSSGATGGRLYLGVNDVDAENNQGEFVATITVG